MATEKLTVKDLQKRKSDSIAEIMKSLSKAFNEGNLRKLSEPKRA